MLSIESAAQDAAPMKRVTCQFRSDRGNLYLYDDSTGMILPWNEEREVALQTILNNTVQSGFANDSSPWIDKRSGTVHESIQRLMQQYGAFVRKPLGSDDAVSADESEKAARENCRQLILTITEDCNLRCRYCCFSADNPYTRTYTKQQMNQDMAVRAIDWFVNYTRPRRMRLGAEGGLGLSFYGGEPLLNMPTLRRSLEHVRDQYRGIFTPVLTTNATLLTRDTLELFVEHSVGLSVSLDGPKEVHDRSRINRSGDGTFNSVMKNLEMMNREFPEYCKTHLRGVCTYDWGINLHAAIEFFSDIQDLLPMGIFVSAVAAADSDYYERFTAEERDIFYQELKLARRRYCQTLICGEEPDPFSNGLIGIQMYNIHNRPRAGDQRPRLLPYSASCLPGSKVAVHVDGTLTTCERVNGTFNLGHIDRGGLDPQRMADMINMFRAVLSECDTCIFTKLCGICFSHLERNSDFRDPSQLCAQVRRSAQEDLRDYVSILEANPTCKFRLSTNTKSASE